MGWEELPSGADLGDCGVKGFSVGVGNTLEGAHRGEEVRIEILQKGNGSSSFCKSLTGRIDSGLKTNVSSRSTTEHKHRLTLKLVWLGLWAWPVQQ